MSFNREPSKQAQGIIFSRKIRNTCNSFIYFNNKSVKQVPSQEHLGIILDTKLNFHEHVENILNYWAITETAKYFATGTTINNIQIVYQTSS